MSRRTASRPFRSTILTIRNGPEAFSIRRLTRWKVAKNRCRASRPNCPLSKHSPSGALIFSRR